MSTRSRDEEAIPTILPTYPTQPIDQQQMYENQRAAYNQVPWLQAVPDDLQPTYTGDQFPSDDLFGDGFDVLQEHAVTGASSWQPALDSHFDNMYDPRSTGHLPPEQPEIPSSYYNVWESSSGNIIDNSSGSTLSTNQRCLHPTPYSAEQTPTEYMMPQTSSKSNIVSSTGRVPQHVFLPSNSQVEVLNQSGQLVNPNRQNKQVWLDKAPNSAPVQRRLEVVLLNSNPSSRAGTPSLSQRSTISPTRSEEPGVLTLPEPTPPQKSMSTQIARLPESQPTSKRAAAASFEEYVTTFAAAPGAVAKVKRRRKLDAKTRESFKQTRKIGACLECRFRKRSCTPGTPCEYCIKIFGTPTTAEVHCHRESPFVGYSVGDYFFLSSKVRIIDFNIKDSVFKMMKPKSFITIDGRSGPCSLPMKIPIGFCSLESLTLQDQAEVWRTKRRPPGDESPESTSGDSIVIIPETDEVLGQRLEAWSIQYAAKFAKYHYEKYPSAYPFNVGLLYVSKKLPEYELVFLMLRVAAMSFILRAGVVCTESEFRTVQARIDTALYRRLSAAESKLFAALHKAVWVSAGRLKREQIYPVAYVIWQTMRLTCQRASHLQNLTTRSKCNKSPAYAKDVERLGHCFNLLLSTHTALFRQNSPMIFDYTDPANADLLAGDEELIKEAMNLRRILLGFRQNNLVRLFRSTNWYQENTYGRLRRVLYGKGNV